MLFRFFRSLFFSCSRGRRESFAFGNAEILEVTIGLYDQGNLARAKVDLKIAGLERVVKDVIWLVPVSEMDRLKKGSIVSIRYTRTGDTVELL